MEVLKINFIRRWEMFIPDDSRKCKKEEDRYEIADVHDNENYLGTRYLVINKKTDRVDRVYRKNDLDFKFYFLDPRTYTIGDNKKGGINIRFEQSMNDILSCLNFIKSVKGVNACHSH